MAHGDSTPAHSLNSLMVLTTSSTYLCLFWRKEELKASWCSSVSPAFIHFAKTSATKLCRRRSSGQSELALDRESTKKSRVKGKKSRTKWVCHGGSFPPVPVGRSILVTPGRFATPLVWTTWTKPLGASWPKI